MGIFGRRQSGGVAGEVAGHAARGADGGWLTATVSVIALLFSIYSVYETSLRQPDLRVFVPAVIQYSSPYQNSNFEVFEVPLTISNVGARSGAVLSFELEVTNPRRKETKRFYSAELGRWTMTNANSGSFRRFTPLALPGKSSLSDSVLFYPPREEKVMQVADEDGPYQFKLSLRTAVPEDLGLIDRLWSQPPGAIHFEMLMPPTDHRNYQEGTVSLNARDWQPSQRGG
jgi:hypothetical protein